MGWPNLSLLIACIYNVYRQKLLVSCMYVFGENTLRQAEANTKWWPGKSEDTFRTDTRT